MRAALEAVTPVERERNDVAHRHNHLCSRHRTRRWSFTAEITERPSREL
jgi:hypothetical protein